MTVFENVLTGNLTYPVVCIFKVILIFKVVFIFEVVIFGNN